MPRLNDLKKILKSRRIDSAKLREALTLTEELRKLGVRKRGYQLASPFSRKRALGKEPESDPRTVQLRHSQG